MTPIAVTIAGSDSSGGAGIQADLKTFSALGVYGASVITALTAQNTKGVRAIHDVPAEFVGAQIDAVFSDLDVSAVKIGMVSQRGVIEAIAAGLARWRQMMVVLDPVMVATSGDELLAPEAREVLKRMLCPGALVITPNLPEAAALLDAPIARTEGEMREQGERLLALGPQAVLIKGGHGSGAKSVDLLIERKAFTRLAADRIATRNTHGTGRALRGGDDRRHSRRRFHVLQKPILGTVDSEYWRVLVFGALLLGSSGVHEQSMIKKKPRPGTVEPAGALRSHPRTWRRTWAAQIIEQVSPGCINLCEWSAAFRPNCQFGKVSDTVISSGTLRRIFSHRSHAQPNRRLIGGSSVSSFWSQ